MKYEKVFAVVGVAVVTGAALLWLRKQYLAYSAVATGSGVTTTATAGQAQQGAIVTSPVNSSNVAFVAPQSTLSLLDGVSTTARNLLGLFIPAGNGDRRQPNGNTVSNDAALSAQAPPQSKPTTYALLTPR